MTFSFLDLAPPLTEDISSLPFVTILVPTLNCSQNLPLTLDSIINQHYPHYEIVVIDGGSTDRTLEVLQGYHSHIRLSSAATYDVYPMLNQGIAMAKGEYINVLFPGDFYIHPKTLWHMMSAANLHAQPELIYCGTLLREGQSVKFLFRIFELSLLKKGQQPTSLQACWFKKETFTLVGDFRTKFQMRGGFDLFCRFFLKHSLRFIAIERAYIDFDLRGVTSGKVIRHFFETGQIIAAYFGKWDLIKWLIRQKDVKRFAKLWFKYLHMAFTERK